ncbi:heavy metal translocating P-type ATPase [Ruminococcus sp. NK3A76]|uniref:heavy metal translocating P-type ATPase n=1 Tax=Ruminococcus sp. NK3A76 TaxID=877411 RepID=UPI00048C2133|nr:heavy metal translocating P-type ATPase [Ruminococcus sp. NK3A76]
MTRKQKKTLTRIIIALVLLVAVSVVDHFAEPAWYVQLLMYLAPYFVIGYDILIKAFKGILNGQVLDENFLMAVATIGAMALGEYREGSAVMLFYQIGELFQGIAVGRSRKNIAALMDIRPDCAFVETEQGVEEADPDDVEVGSIIVVKPGEKIPIDGVIIEGDTTLNTSALTGESMPVDAIQGDNVQSGSINLTALIRVKTTKPFGESTVSKILELVENSGERKSRSENFITKFARYYTPAVCISALLLGVGVPLVRMLTGSSAMFGEWISRALTFLVISCPCALVISIPLSFFAAIGGAGSEGILIKGGEFIETLSKTKYVVFDKTGTMTRGVFEVVGIHHSSIEEEKLLEIAALAEQNSNHPIAKSIVRACKSLPDSSRLSKVSEFAGEGVCAVIDGREIYVGNDKLMKRAGADYTECHSAGTVIHISSESEYMGHIVVADVLKPTSREAIKQLGEAGISQTVMLTGDGERAAEAAAKELGIDKLYSRLMPADKVDKVEELLAQKPSGAALAFVGDGINDAPVLTRADIGIAMGALGSDAAIEAADVVLMDDDPVKIAKAIRLSRRCMCIVYENIVFAIGVKLICLLLGALGIANMWIAIFADVGVMVLAVLNAVRMLSKNK